MTKITERGMIFNAEMVRAILDGRKTQTRRVVKFKLREPGLNLNFSGLKLGHYRTGDSSSGYVLASRGAMGCWNDKTFPAHCPYGQPGDRIWVRETFGDCGERLVYRADIDDGAKCKVERWTPSIHMPRWASRILLEITDVRVERLNSISEEDARAEGVPPAGDLLPDYPDTYLTPAGDFATAKVAFHRLWQSIYGDDSWPANSWVWVIEFKRIEGDDHATD
ncbi:morphogenetic protein [Leclercia adecarboxylata]|uniref:morphogenetic protein n=1 Tax=Leclercia adecarboxylata TaxID=83655 RepID=UPI0013DF23DC|nr:morphogenetic protein [Leclercia adecarboxylata]MCE9982484.1 morphogenetic protein [Leclercia adecarboxylata]QIG33058.1 morphogenetic protein [Leclercia adecarboxylata]